MGYPAFTHAACNSSSLAGSKINRMSKHCRFFFLCNCSSGFTLIYCICPHATGFWCQFSLINAKGIKAILVFP